MKPMKKINRIKSLMSKHSFTSADARKLGVHSSVLHYYVKKGIIERIDRGVYRNPNYESGAPFQWEDLIQTILSIKNGVICLISALAYWELTEEIPRQFWIAVPNQSKAPVRKNVKIIRMRNFKLGTIKVKVGNATIYIYNRERTIIDAFRLLDKEVAVKALKFYLNSKKYKPDINKLIAYGKKLRIDINPYILAITT